MSFLHPGRGVGKAGVLVVALPRCPLVSMNSVCSSTQREAGGGHRGPLPLGGLCRVCVCANPACLTPGSWEEGK